VDATRDDTSLYAVSSSAVLAKQAMPTAASAARAVVWSPSRKAMVNGDGSVVIDAAATLRFVSSGVLGDTIRADGQKVLVARPDAEPVVFDLANEAHLAFFAEMAAIFHTLETADTDSAVSPPAVAFLCVAPPASSSFFVLFEPSPGSSDDDMSLPSSFPVLPTCTRSPAPHGALVRAQRTSPHLRRRGQGWRGVQGCGAHPLRVCGQADPAGRVYL